MPSEERGNQVREAKDVEGTGQHGAGNAVEDGSIPGYLRAVDREMRRDGAVETLLDEDLVTLFEIDILCCCVSGERMLGPELDIVYRILIAKSATVDTYLDCIRLFDVIIDAGAASLERAVFEKALGC